MTFFWQNPILNPPSERPKPGQKIEVRIGWKEPGVKGTREMWRTCKVYDAGGYLACSGRAGDFTLKGVKRWKKGDEDKPGRRWRPKR